MACAQQTLEAPPAKQQQADQDESDRDDKEDPKQESGKQQSKDQDEKDLADKDEKEGDKKDPADKDEEKQKEEDKDQADKEEEKEQDYRRRRRRSRRSGNLAYTKKSEKFVSAFAPVVAPTTNAIVRILNDKKQVALGTIVDADGLILTKASELGGELICELADGSTHKPSIVGIDPKTDLVLLRVDKKGLKPAKIAEVKTPSVGSWLATVGHEEKPVAIGIVSHEPRVIINNVPNAAFIGIGLQDREDGGGVRVNNVFNDSPAATSGLLVNDVIIGIDDDEIENRRQLQEKLSHFQPSDDIVLKIKRSEEVMEVPLTLGSRRTNRMDRGAQQNRMGSVLSNRKSDFPLALQHDTALNANQVGGPIVNLSGKIIGINIARDGRVSSLALPNEIVLPVIEKLKTGEFPPEVVNKDEINRVEKQLVTLDKGLDSLPNEKMEKELENSAGSAREDELKRQIKEVEDRLQKLRERYQETRKSNQRLKDSIEELTGRQDRYEDRIGPLKKELKRLKTGVQPK